MTSIRVKFRVGATRGAVVRACGVLGTSILVLIGVAVVEPQESAAARLPFPASSGWINPVATEYEDWDFGRCTGHYRPGLAHLGADSQGAAAGTGVQALGGGKVVQLVNWGSGHGQALAVEQVAGDGTRFMAVYGHVVPGVSVGVQVSPGQRLGTVLAQGSNSHLHLGVRPLEPGEDASRVSVRGSSACINGVADSLGYADPMPWLEGHPASESGDDAAAAVRAGDFDGDGVDDLALRRGTTYFFDFDLDGDADRQLGWGRTGDVLVGRSLS